MVGGMWAVRAPGLYRGRVMLGTRVYRQGHGRPHLRKAVGPARPVRRGSMRYAPVKVVNTF